MARNFLNICLSSVCILVAGSCASGKLKTCTQKNSETEIALCKRDVRLENRGRNVALAIGTGLVVGAIAGPELGADAMVAATISATGMASAQYFKETFLAALDLRAANYNSDVQFADEFHRRMERFESEVVLAQDEAIRRARNAHRLVQESERSFEENGEGIAKINEAKIQMQNALEHCKIVYSLAEGFILATEDSTRSAINNSERVFGSNAIVDPYLDDQATTSLKEIRKRQKPLGVIAKGTPDQIDRMFKGKWGYDKPRR